MTKQTVEKVPVKKVSFEKKKKVSFEKKKEKVSLEKKLPVKKKKETVSLVKKKKKLKIVYDKKLDDEWDWFGINGLPEEDLLLIFEYLGILNCYILKTVSKKWYRIITGEFALPKWINRYIPPKYSPFQYQFDVIKWMRLQQYGGILSMAPGMGKTMTTLTYINISYSQRNLVICNKSQMSVWKEETEKFYGDKLSILCCHSECDGMVADFDQDTLSTYDIVVVTYQQAKEVTNPANAISKIFWNNVFCDEVHTLRNRPKSMYPFVDKINKSRLWGLTGSLIFNKISDARNIQALVDANSIYSYHNIKVLSFEDVDIKLPVLNIHRISTTRTTYQNHLYQLYDTKALDTIAQLGAHSKNLAAIWTIIHRMRQLSISPVLLKKSHSKMPNLTDNDTYKSPRIEHICNSIQNDDSPIDPRQSLVFSYYTGTLDLIHQNLKERGIKSIIVKSADDIQQRKYLIDKFLQGEYRVLLMTYAIGSLGYNLTKASKVYLAEVWWNMQVMQQAFRRAYRLGQERQVDVYMYATDNSIESRMLELCLGKQDIETVLINDCKPKGKLTLAEIKTLF